MERTVERTLVKSPPELWELIDDPALMGRWGAGLLGLPGELPAEITLREAGERIAWRCSAPAGSAHLDLSFAEKGFGTCVTICAAGEELQAASEAKLVELLDELAAPKRRPFARAR